MSLVSLFLRGTKMSVCYKQFRQEVSSSTCQRIYTYIIFVVNTIVFPGHILWDILLYRVIANQVVFAVSFFVGILYIIGGCLFSVRISA